MKFGGDHPNQWLNATQALAHRKCAFVAKLRFAFQSPSKLFLAMDYYPAGSLDAALDRAARESDVPNFKGSFLGRFPLVSADFWTSDHLSERSRSVDAVLGTVSYTHLTLPTIYSV